MAEYTIDKIEFGGNTYKLQDNVSGYTTNTGTLTSAVTSLTTTAGAHTTISNKTGATSIAIPTKTSHLTNDSGYITNAGVTKITTSAGAHTTISNKTGAVSFNIPTTAAHVGAIATTGGTMTGQLKTSFKESIAMGSYGSSQTTVPNLVEEIRLSSGCMGSVNIGTAYSASGYTIATGWYNFIYSPHRSGGANGQASGDNTDYGNLFLLGMNNNNGQFIVRVANKGVAQVIKLVEENTLSNYVLGSALGDYVTEQGTSNGWNYKKYHNGSIEAWSIRTTTLTSYTTVGNFAGYSWTDIPTPFTMGGTNYTIEAEWKIGSGFSVSGGVGSKTKAKFQLFGLGSASGSQSCTVCIHLFGS